MGYKNNDRCLDKVDEDEPIFVLRAQDRLAINTIEWWLRGALDHLDDERFTEVRECIARFEQWQEAHPSRVKWPD